MGRLILNLAHSIKNRLTCTIVSQFIPEMAQVPSMQVQVRVQVLRLQVQVQVHRPTISNSNEIKQDS